MITVNKDASEQRIKTVAGKILDKVKELAENGVSCSEIQYSSTSSESHEIHSILKKEGIEITYRGHAILGSGSDGLKRYSTRFCWGE